MEENKVKTDYQLVIIGGSAGSFDVLLRLVARLRTDLSMPVVMVVHRKLDNDSLMEELLANRSTLPVKEAEDKDELKPNVIYVAPADYHLLFEKDKTISLDASEKVNFSRPSIDVSFQSAAEVYHSSLVCVLLSGANSDGTEGLRAAKQNGALLVVQNPDSAEVGFMPRQALNALEIDYVLNEPGIIQLINNLVNSQ
jgi:two-component system, chemotaxis family, protein-glutamate methylesterase/glutaminase